MRIIGRKFKVRSWRVLKVIEECGYFRGHNYWVRVIVGPYHGRIAGEEFIMSEKAIKYNLSK